MPRRAGWTFPVSDQCARRPQPRPALPGTVDPTEDDLILGEGGRSAVGTLVERTTRLLLLLHLDGGRAAVNVEAAMRAAITTLPDQLCRSITWDQGAEMSTHARFTTATGIPIYFCDPHSPWQRGPNENTNALIPNTSPRAPTSPPNQPPTCCTSSTASTIVHAGPSAT